MSDFEPSGHDQKRSISLEDIIDPDKSLPENYRGLVIRQEQNNEERFLDSEYSEAWFDYAYNQEWWGDLGQLTPEMATNATKFFQNRLSDQLLVDLGGGGGTMLRPSRIWGVETYVNVDRGHYRRTEKPEEDKGSEPTVVMRDYRTQAPFDTRVIKVNSDILDFVSRLKDGAANITINGIDSFIIDDDEYNEVLANEIIRATKPNGLIFGVNSNALSFLEKMAREKNPKIRLIDTKEEYGFPIILDNMKVFEKIV